MKKKFITKKGDKKVKKENIKEKRENYSDSILSTSLSFSISWDNHNILFSPKVKVNGNVPPCPLWSGGPHV